VTGGREAGFRTRAGMTKNLYNHSVKGGIEEGFRIHPPQADKSRKDSRQAGLPVGRQE